MKPRSEIQSFLKDLNAIAELPTSAKYHALTLAEYPFDAQLVAKSHLYRQSRKMYLSLGGRFSPRVCSTMRALSAQDLFKDEIDYTPSFSELTWFQKQGHLVSDANEELESLMRFNEISVFHEQNHRIIWRLLPRAPSEKRDLARYLNFAESLVVMLDLALGDELGAKLSTALERMKLIYRPGGQDQWHKKSKKVYRDYLKAAMCTTYYALEILHNDDILKAVDYVLPGQKQINKVAVRRGLQLSELFTRVTNPQWQELYWKSARAKLGKIQSESEESALYLPVDPLDLNEEFMIVDRVLDVYGL